MLNFGQLRERFEGIIGHSINAGTLASWIDEAQEEISGEYGQRTKLWYPREINRITAEINEYTTTIPVENGALLPMAPDYVNLGTGKAMEKIHYGNIVGNSMVNVSRGEHGTTPNIWGIGTGISMLAEAGVEHDLPDDLYILHEVRDTRNYPVMGYQVDAEMKITFFKEGPFRIIYTPVPTRIDPNDNSSVPAVHQMFHNLLLVYCTAKYWQKNAEGIPAEENKAMSLLNEFSMRVHGIGRKLRNNENQNYEIGIDLW